jgi:hypothetical protein
MAREMTPKRVLRSLLAVVVGLLAISVVVEFLEFGLVTLVNGEMTTDPDVYYGVRNAAWFLGVKLFYNTVAAVGAGYLCALIARHAELKHGLALAVVQTLAFAWALSRPEMSGWTPGWMWAALIVLTFSGILVGARFRASRCR